MEYNNKYKTTYNLDPVTGYAQSGDQVWSVCEHIYIHRFFSDLTSFWNNVR